MNHISNVGSFERSWPTFSEKLDECCGIEPSAENIFRLGSQLSTIFQSNSKEGRSQESLAGGGAAWECLVTWYLNLVFWGTEVLVSKQKKDFIPKIINDSLCVTISNHATNTESDVIAFNVPHGSNLYLKLSDINDLVEENILDVVLSVIQCKTNWNDNSQIPMLWDLIYNSSSFRLPHVSVGRNGFNPSSFGKFGYSFVTVPTVKKPPKPSDVSVRRVTNLTGGNYWGKESESGVCRSLNEFFGKNYSSFFVGGVQTHINQQIQSDSHYYKRFRLLDFSD